MTNPTQEIPAEEMERMKADAKHKFPFNDRAIFQGIMQDGYIEGAKAEYLRARQLKQLGPEDQQSFTQSLLDILRQHVKIRGHWSQGMYLGGLKEAAEHLFLFVGGTIDAVYEGAAQWEEKYNDVITRQQAQGETNKDHAIAFAKWINNSWYTPHYAKWIHIREGLAGMKTAEELYEIFLKEEPPAPVQYTSDSPDAEDIPVPEEIKQFIGGYLGKVVFTGNGMSEGCKAMVAMYRKLKDEIEDQRVRMESMGRVIQKVMKEADEAKAQLSAREQEAGDYRKALEEIISIHKKYYNSGEMNNSTANHLFNIANEVIIKYSSPPTK